MQFRLPKNFVWKRIDLPVDGLAGGLRGLRIVHLSDLHLRSFWGKPYDQLITSINASKADMIVLTGDLVENRMDYRPALATVKRLLTALSSRLGTFAVQGNHDPDLLMPRLAEMNVKFLNRQRWLVQGGANGQEIELIGLPGHRRDDLDLSFLRDIPAKRPGVPRIVLSHYPDLLPPSLILEPDIYMTGHSHGGQICLPGGRPLVTHNSLPRHFVRGVHRVNNTWFVISSGLGFTGLPLRFFCPAEVGELILGKHPATQ